MGEMTKPFPVSPPAAIASFPFTDIAEGTGVVLFYGGTHKEDTTLSYFLSTIATTASEIQTNAGTQGASFVKILDHDFDIKFNLPKRLKGKIYAVATIGGNDSATADNSGEGYIIYKIRKWDGSTETEIAEAQSETVVVLGAPNITQSKMTNTEIDISSVVQFKAGESLRITVEFWGRQTAGNNLSNIGYAHDPTDRNDEGSGSNKIIEDDDSTQLKFLVPFILDL